MRHCQLPELLVSSKLERCLMMCLPAAVDFDGTRPAIWAAGRKYLSIRATTQLILYDGVTANAELALGMGQSIPGG